MPRVTLSVLSRNGGTRLGQLLQAAARLADQIVVGLDAASDDATADIAAHNADVVFRFHYKADLSAARMSIFEHARGDWILMIDDDELLEPQFADVLRELISSTVITHCWFPRKWIVNDAPYEFLLEPAWYPDWQLRLFRNDARIVWKPPRPHSGYHVLGPGQFDARASILHLEPLLLTADQRRAKLEGYRASGASGSWERQYEDFAGTARRTLPDPFRPTVADPVRPGRSAGIVAGPREAAAVRDERWGCEIIEVTMEAIARPGQRMIAEVDLRNTGSLFWAPNWGLRSANLAFSHHVLDERRKVLVWDCERTSIRSMTPPGAATRLIHSFSAPGRPGKYLIAWDMLNEGERWFAPDAGASFCTALEVCD